MRKIMCLLIIMTFLSCSAQAGTQVIKLDESNVLSEDQIDIALNNDPVNCTVLKQNDTLYIDTGFFTDYFKIPPEQMASYAGYEGTIKEGNKDITLVPLFSVLTALGMRYTYNPVFNKDIVRIRTDRDFSVNTSYTYTPSTDSSQGNLPVSSTDYTLSASSGSDYNYPYDYDTYYPPGYVPGYYFGSYGYVGNRVPARPIVRPNPPLMPLHGGGGTFHGGGRR